MEIYTVCPHFDNVSSLRHNEQVSRGAWRSIIPFVYTFQGTTNCNYFVYLHAYISFTNLSKLILFLLQNVFLCTSINCFSNSFVLSFSCCVINVELSENKEKELELVLNV